MKTERPPARDRARQPGASTAADHAPTDAAATSPAPGDVEQILDEMLQETFPASDAPQLDGLPLDGKPATNAVPKHPGEHPPPPDVGNTGSDDTGPFDRRRQTYSLGDVGHVTLQTSGAEVDVAFSAPRLTLDAAALEQLIAALERHRPSLHAR